MTQGPPQRASDATDDAFPTEGCCATENRDFVVGQKHAGRVAIGKCRVAE